MHQNYTKSQFARRSAAAHRHPVGNDEASGIAGPELELLRILQRALDEQRTTQPVEEPTPALVSRIETILGKRLEAANDSAIGEPIEPPPAFVAQMQVVEPVHEAALSVDHSEPELHHEAHSRSISKLLPAVALLCALGAAVGALAPTGPVKHTASGTLAVRGAVETRAAMTRAVEKMLVSPRVIAAAVSTLKLDHDPEFSGTATGALNVAADLLSVRASAIDPVSRAEASLISAIQSSTNDRTGAIDFSVTTGSVDKSARIAGYLASAVTRSTQPSSADGDALKKESDTARAAFDAFVKQSGEGNVKVATGLQRQIADVDAELKAAGERIVTTKESADRLKAAKVGDILAGVLPPQALSPALEDKRERYVTAKASLAQLSASLGPRHPRLLAQQAETDSLRSAVADELGHLQRRSADDARAAAAEKRQFDSRRNALIAQSRDTGVDLAKLTELHDKAIAAQTRLEDAISTGSLPSDAAQVMLLKAPQVTTTPSAAGRWPMSIIGGFIGLGFGVIFAVARLLRGRGRTTSRIEPSMPSTVVADQP
ncbi:succinoglycan biosynthesis protein [Rhizobium sp. S152]|uniref:succinoglycan biosynthesis protein n=1 Tax=Rhizobium sp. S152 TaxID=3055038 RepID=UPI0025A9E0CD|nr:succinoglycan biosynthesis protein [Rhizobium sp. S152]MDM9626426.1 succinoglycan biosynthesis protein [Rhizobium sp. S152]